MNSAIKDNRKRGKVGDFLKDSIKSGSHLSFVSAYFTIYAYDRLKSELHQADHLRFLFGEPRFVKNLDPDRTDKKAFKIEDDSLALKNRLQQKCLARECADWISEKVSIKSIKQTNLLHGKLYHIDDDGRKKALVGSSNFTVSGLGYGANPNIELNLEVADDRDRKDLKEWFDEIWQNDELVEDVKQEVLDYLGQLYAENSPQFIYYKTLYHIFEKFLAEQSSGGLLDERTNFFDSKIWNALFDFQKDGVKGAINKILTHNGCIIADSVGLGKTFEALAVIKYFELLNQNVLVLCPKKLRENWVIYQAANPTELNLFREDRFCYSVLSHTDLSRDGGKSGDIDLASINWGNFGLVVIDESHNFRNNSKGKKDEEGRLIRKSRYERLMEEVIQQGVKTKVLLLSATPVNNNLRDLRNQLHFISEGRDDAYCESLRIASIASSLKNAQTVFTHWSKQSERDVRQLLERLDASFFKLLDELTIARSRKHIQRYYKESLHQVGEFPKRAKPQAIYPLIDLNNQFMSYDQLNREIHNYKLSLFKPSVYVAEEFKLLYVHEAVKNFSQELREDFLIGMMKVNFLKRLESSISSFALSMQRTIEKIKGLEDKLQRFQENQGTDATIDLDDLHMIDDDDAETEDAWEVGGKIKYNLRHIEVERWLLELANDRKQLTNLFQEARKVTVERDAKLGHLKDLIKQKVENPTINRDGKENRKVLVFTAFADTARYLYDACKEWARQELNVHIALVSGGATPNLTTFGQNDFNHILTNFSPVSKSRNKMKSMRQDEEIDILIATDCISEGQNLQDCDTLINYDIHWNPVRIIQRFGRIDRIGSRNKIVHLINFWPTKDLDNYIALKDRVEARMALVDLAATSEDNLLQEDIRELIEGDIRYRDQQLKRMRDEVLDLEDVNDGVSLSEFTLDDFRIELSNYIEVNRKALEDAPLGLYAVVPSPAEGSAAQIGRPGVIFCLRQVGDTSGNEQVNPLQPCYLVYVRDDGEVRFNFTHAKHILELFRAAAAGQNTAIESLCDIFNNETCHGNDMANYDGLLEKVVLAIKNTFRKRNIGGLFSGRDGRLVAKVKQVAGAEDFELITWLVIKNSKP